MGDTYTSNRNVPLWTEPDPPEFDYSKVGLGLMVSKHGVCQVDYRVTGTGERNGHVVHAVNGSYFGSSDGPSVTVSPTPVRTLGEVFAGSSGTVEDFGRLPWGPDEDDMDGISPDDAGGYIERDIGEMTVKTPVSLLGGRGLWYSGVLDMGFPGNEKMWKSISVDLPLNVPIIIGVAALRGRYPGEFHPPVYYTMGANRPMTAVAVTGIAHQVIVFCNNPAVGVPFDAITVNFELTDNRNLHGYTRPLSEAR